MSFLVRPHRPFSKLRYLARGVLLFSLIGVVSCIAYRLGFLDGYFALLPIVVVFYALLGLGTGLMSRKLVLSALGRGSSMLLLVSMGRLLLSVMVTGVGLWCMPEHKWSFLLLSLVCYFAAMLESLVAVLRK